MKAFNENRWRPVRLRNEESVQYLNKLLAKGWYLMDLGLDDLPFLAFLVPLDPARKGPKIAGELTSILSLSLTAKGYRRMPSDGSGKAMPVIVLTRGREKERQMAVATTRDETGYIDMGKDRTDREQWRPLLGFPLEEGGYVTIYERRGGERGET